MTHDFLRDRSHSEKSLFTSGYSKKMPTATNALETKSQKKSDWALFSSAFLAGDSIADDEVCRMKANWKKLLIIHGIDICSGFARCSLDLAEKMMCHNPSRTVNEKITEIDAEKQSGKRKTPDSLKRDLGENAADYH